MRTLGSFALVAAAIFLASPAQAQDNAGARAARSWRQAHERQNCSRPISGSSATVLKTRADG